MRSPGRRLSIVEIVPLGSPSRKRRLIYSNPTLLRRVLCLTSSSQLGLPERDDDALTTRHLKPRDWLRIMI